MIRSRKGFLRALVFGASVTVTLAGCAVDKDELGKGEVAGGLPPGTPGQSGGLGKADDAARVVAVDLQSQHPYQNDTYQTFNLALDALVPWCAHQTRVHFAVLRTERDYDFVSVKGSADTAAQVFDGTHDDTWSEWRQLDAENKHIDVVLDTDYSITRHGFEIDSVEWAGAPICPMIAIPPCAAGQVDVNPPRGVCECPAMPTCVAVADIEITHTTAHGHNVRGHQTSGTGAFDLAPGPADGIEAKQIGTVAETAVFDVMRLAASLRVLAGPSYETATNPGEHLVIRFGAAEIRYAAPVGEHSAAVAQVVAAFESLFLCASEDAITCATGLVCADDNCVAPGSCSCTEEYTPVCGENGVTYGNACKAVCASAPVVHPGECGITGDLCGTIRGLSCRDGFRCRFDVSIFDYPYPDAGGACVAQDYCDAPTDCDHLVHIAVPGAWACNANTCAWETGIVWSPVAGWSFATSHPYGNNQSVWKKLYLPAGAQQMRLSAAGVFALENGYDKLEVWTWQNGAWKKVKTFTGSQGPTADDVFAGRYHYLHFVSDVSVTEHGFDLTAAYTTAL
jgi:hypothetical protein